KRLLNFIPLFALSDKAQRQVEVFRQGVLSLHPFLTKILHQFLNRISHFIRESNSYKQSHRLFRLLFDRNAGLCLSRPTSAGFLNTGTAAAAPPGVSAGSEPVSISAPPPIPEKSTL